MSKRILKSAVNAAALACMFPAALLAGFGRIEVFFHLFGQMVAQVPGLPGDYLRVAYYFMTLKNCSLHSRVSFGTFFAQSSTMVGRGVYIGSYCVLGSCSIGERTQIASQVQILSGPAASMRATNRAGFSAPNRGRDTSVGGGRLLDRRVGHRHGRCRAGKHGRRWRCGHPRSSAQRGRRRKSGARHPAGRVMSVSMSAEIPVLMMSRELGLGGIERDVSKFARTLGGYGIAPHVACFNPGGCVGRRSKPPASRCCLFRLSRSSLPRRGQARESCGAT